MGSASPRSTRPSSWRPSSRRPASSQQEDRGHVPSLVLWPEDVVSLDTPLADSPEEAALSGLARALQTTLVVGVTETVSSTAFRNEIVAWGPDGTLVARFEKVHRVPFGEYVPYRSFFAHLGNLSAVPLDAVPGTGTGLLDTPAAPLGAMVSYEVFYADRGRAAVRAGAAAPHRPHQHLLLCHRPGPHPGDRGRPPSRPCSRAATSCRPRPPATARPSPTAAPCSSRSVLGAPQIVPATLSRRAGWTVYVRYGDLPPLVLAAVALARRRGSSPIGTAVASAGDGGRPTHLRPGAGGPPQVRTRQVRPVRSYS